MPLATTLSVRLDYDLTKVLDLVSARAQSAFAKALALAHGTGAGQADKLFLDSRLITGAVADSLDMSGALLDPLGDPFILARVKGILLYAFAENPNPIELTRPAAGVPFMKAAGDALIVRPGGLITLWATDATGYVVTSTTADIIDVVNTVGGNANYDVAIVGASA
jgi:hypothetical protein